MFVPSVVQKRHHRSKRWNGKLLLIPQRRVLEVGVTACLWRYWSTFSKCWLAKMEPYLFYAGKRQNYYRYERN